MRNGTPKMIGTMNACGKTSIYAGIRKIGECNDTPNAITAAYAAMPDATATVSPFGGITHRSAMVGRNISPMSESDAGIVWITTTPGSPLDIALDRLIDDAASQLKGGA